MPPPSVASWYYDYCVLANDGDTLMLAVLKTIIQHHLLATFTLDCSINSGIWPKKVKKRLFFSSFPCIRYERIHCSEDFTVSTPIPTNPRTCTHRCTHTWRKPYTDARTEYASVTRYCWYFYRNSRFRIGQSGKASSGQKRLLTHKLIYAYAACES